MQKLQLTFTYGDRSPHLEIIDADPAKMHRFGRRDFARWFELAEPSLQSTISREHFHVRYDAEGERFAVIECSKEGSGFRLLSTGDEERPFEWRHGEQLLLGPRSQLRIRATPANDDYVYVTFEYDGATGATGSLERPLLLERLCQLLDHYHCAHLIGLPGGGKQKLVRELAGATAPGLRLGGLFTVSTLPIMVDGLMVDVGETDTLWRALSRAILKSASAACRSRGYPMAGERIEQILIEFDTQPPDTPDEALATFERAFRCVRERAFQNPLLILTHFDALYADLEADMLYCLARLRTEWHELSDHIYLVITTNRPSAMLRIDDAQPARETRRRHFDNLFVGATLTVRHNGPFKELWQTLHPGNTAPSLNSAGETTLERLTGNHLAIAEGARNVINMWRWLSVDGTLSPAVETYRWTDPPQQACINIWQALEPSEQRHLLDLVAGQPIADGHQRRLYDLGLLTADGRIFSDILAHAIVGLQSARSGTIPTYGLHADEKQRRVYVNGQEVVKKETRESQFFWALYNKPNTTVPFIDLLVATNEEYNVAAFKKDYAFRKLELEALSRLASRVTKKVGRVYIKNVHGKGYMFQTDAA